MIPSRRPGPVPFLILLLVLVLPVAGRGQEARRSGCDAPIHHEFDFWIGTWDITQTIHGPGGEPETYAARNVVRPAAGGCALVERWAGTVRFPWAGMAEPDSLHGLSVRYVDPADGRWRIEWMDDRRPAFGAPFVGGFEDGVGTFERGGVTAAGDSLVSRIVFRPVTPDSVEWRLSISTDRGASWAPLWEMTFRRASDEDALRAAHATILRAHRQGDLPSWTSLEADDYVEANRGRVTFPTREERRARRDPYLRETRFTRYEDLRDPIVVISDDGTVGWLIAEVAARGSRKTAEGTEEPLEFVAAWIELYRKIEGRWRLVGNVSNLR